jgi:hypothetical protein
MSKTNFGHCQMYDLNIQAAYGYIFRIVGIIAALPGGCTNI